MSYFSGQKCKKIGGHRLRFGDKISERLHALERYSCKKIYIKGNSNQLYLLNEHSDLYFLLQISDHYILGNNQGKFNKKIMSTFISRESPSGRSR